MTTDALDSYGSLTTGGWMTEESSALQGGPLASLMVHIRVGSASFGDHDRLKFALGEEVLLSDDDYQGVVVRSAGIAARSGRQVGSR